MNINKLIDPKLLIQMIDAGYVTVVSHPTEPLVLYNSAKASTDQVWNEATEVCRGLIVHKLTGEVVARPFRKFHDYEHLTDAERAQMVGPIHVTEALDGTLGITYWAPEARKWQVATRDGFDTEDAKWANKYMAEKLAPQGVGNTDGPTEQTALVEIIHPGYKNVVDYKGREALPLLAIIDHETGQNVLPNLQSEVGTRINWPDGVAQEFTFDSIDAVLAARPKDNAVGYVVHYVFSDLRVKVPFTKVSA